MWSWPLPNVVPWVVPTSPMPGAFGSSRTHEQHTGVDLYAPVGSKVCAVEDGIIRKVMIDTFTGPAAHPPSPWWLYTSAILVEGASGLITYGEIDIRDGFVRGLLREGASVVRGQVLGTVIPVLPKDRGNGTTMLHLELYKSWDACPSAPVTWVVGAPMPEGLLDPTLFLVQAWTKVTQRFHKAAEEAPTDPHDSDTPEARRNLIEWLQLHPLWTHPANLLVPPMLPDGEEPPEDLYDRTGWVMTEIQMGAIQYCVRYEFEYVDPTTERVEGENGWYSDARNTDFRVWIECGGWVDLSKNPNLPCPPEGWDDHNRWVTCHDTDLDCGGATMEEALVELALRVMFYYGQGREKKAHPECEGSFDAEEHYDDGCVDDGTGFCPVCGFVKYYMRDDE